MLTTADLAVGDRVLVPDTRQYQNRVGTVVRVGARRVRVQFDGFKSIVYYSPRALLRLHPHQVLPLTPVDRLIAAALDIVNTHGYVNAEGESSLRRLIREAWNTSAHRSPS